MSTVHLSQSQTRVYNVGPSDAWRLISAEVERQARELANRTSHRVEIYTFNGTLIGTAEPRFTADSAR